MKRLFAAVLAAAVSTPVVAADGADTAYFLLDGNPVAARYSAHRLVRLPTQDAPDAAGLAALESVAAFSTAARATRLDRAGRLGAARVSPPRVPAYGTPMFDVTAEGDSPGRAARGALAWTGSTPFAAVALAHRPVDARLRQALVRESRRLVAPRLDFRAYAPVGRQLQVEGPVRVREDGTDAAPGLAFVEIVWKIHHLPAALADRGIDSTLPYLVADMVVHRRTGQAIFRDVASDGGLDDREVVLFKEPGGPLLMATPLPCLDGAEPFVIDLDHETYGAGRADDVPAPAHCFPAQ